MKGMPEKWVPDLEGLLLKSNPYKAPQATISPALKQKLSEEEIDIPANVSAEIKEFIMRKRANGLPESYIREALKAEFGIIEI